MFITNPLNSKEKYIWTQHAHQKMRYYRLSESRIQRIIRFPARIEEGIMDQGIACMQPAGGKVYSEIWAMYVLVGPEAQRRMKIITCWRYPGKSPSRDPIPQEIIKEIEALL